ncbi:AlpA family phage regulatory protein [Escherichia coli]|uniref:helix-turn-helix transcriptional regulator n=1 Tax=Escherichia coli TaxID=562 RepID=UPI0021BE0CEC|nr:AlpA family phage regulatory protein [Escherichia coli]MCT9829185.1 AlpA family phage regulatory protein [Escherichia coli]
MKGAIGKKDLVKMVPVSMSTIDSLEKRGEFPKRWFITDKRVVWNRDEVEQWLDERKKNSPDVYIGKKPPVHLRRRRPVNQSAA